MGSDKRQTQDERTLNDDTGDDAREEYTGYRQVDPERKVSRGEAEAAREAELQPSSPDDEDAEPDAGGA